MNLKITKETVNVRARRIENPAPIHFKNNLTLLAIVNKIRELFFLKPYNIPLKWWKLCLSSDEIRAIHGLPLENELIRQIQKDANNKNQV